MLNEVGGIRAKKGRVKPKGHSGLWGKVSTSVCHSPGLYASSLNMKLFTEHLEN